MANWEIVHGEIRRAYLKKQLSWLRFAINRERQSKVLGIIMTDIGDEDGLGADEP